MHQRTASSTANAATVASTSTSTTAAAHTCTGVVAAMLTPCQAPGQPDPHAMQRLAHTLIQQGCHGLFVLGSTGELPVIDEDDRRSLIAAAREGAGDAPLIYAGVSGLGVKQSIRYAQLASRDGANIAIVMAPFFIKLSQHELHAYITAIADASPIPVGFYHHLRMPSQFEADTVARLAQHPNIVVMKDTSLEAQRTSQLVQATASSDMAVFQGREVFLLSSLQSGAHGFVTALAGVAPEWHRSLFDAHHAGDHEQAHHFQERIANLARMFSFQEVQQSFAHFAYLLRYAAQQRGWIDNAHGMIPGFTPEPAFQRKIAAHLQATQLVPPGT